MLDDSKADHQIGCLDGCTFVSGFKRYSATVSSLFLVAKLVCWFTGLKQPNV